MLHCCRVAEAIETRLSCHEDLLTREAEALRRLDTSEPGAPTFRITPQRLERKSDNGGAAVDNDNLTGAESIFH